MHLLAWEMVASPPGRCRWRSNPASRVDPCGRPTGTSAVGGVTRRLWW